MAVTWYALYNVADGTLISQESDECSQRLTDAQLQAKGVARKVIAGPVASGEQWNPATLKKESAPVVNDPRVALTVKASGSWTLADIADWLKASA